MKLATLPMEELAPLLQLQLDNGGTANLVVTGVSMFPTLRHRRDTVVLTTLERPLRRGDLILYTRKSGQYVLHRIVTKPKNGAFICSGDNQWRPEPVEQSQVKALVKAYIRNGKRIDVNSFGCRLWVGFWVAVFPVRRPLLWAGHLLLRIRRWMKKKTPVLKK